MEGYGTNIFGHGKVARVSFQESTQNVFLLALQCKWDYRWFKEGKLMQYTNCSLKMFNLIFQFKWNSFRKFGEG